MEHTKRCCRCNEIKVLYEFYRNRSQPDGKAKECKDCQKQVKNGGGYRLNGNGKVPYSADVAPYLSGYSPAEAVKKFCKTETEVPRHERIIKHIKTRDLPQWFCWNCRRWHTSAVERSDCPHCNRPLRQSGPNFSAWRVLAL